MINQSNKKDELLSHFQSETNKYYFGFEELWDNEKYLINYNNHIVKQISKEFVKNNTILEYGSGIGTLSVILKENFKNVECLEIDERSIKILNERNLKCYKDIREIQYKKFDCIFSSNVLEHIENDKKAISDISKIIKEGGILSLYVPAFQILYSELDSKMGHYRRYHMNDLKKKLIDLNFSIIRCHYADSIGFFASMAIKFFGYKKAMNLGNKDSLKFYDRFIFPFSQLIDKLGFKYFLGKNLILIAKYNYKKK